MLCSFYCGIITLMNQISFKWICEDIGWIFIWMRHPILLDTSSLFSGWNVANDSPSTRHVMDNDVIKCRHFPRYWPFVRGIHRSPVNYPHIGQWRGALMFSLICAWKKHWVNNRDAGDLRRHRAHYDIIIMNWDVQNIHYQHKPQIIV